MGNKKLQVWLPVLFALVMVWGMIIGYQLSERTGASRFFASTKRNSLQEVLDLVRSKYVDPIPADSINGIVIEDLLARLDPHSTYIPAADLQMVNDDLNGNFQGIGVEFQFFRDTVNVTNVIKDGPSAKAGLQVGDKIVKVNDSIDLTSKKIMTEDIRRFLRGPGGTPVNVTIVRNGAVKKVTITRGTITVSTIDAAYMITPQTGYIRINKFGERTYEEFMENLEKLQKQKMTQLILDLRGNGGGLMNEATDIADEFLDDNKLIVYTEGDKYDRNDYTCKRPGLFEKGKLVVLVDETSASASEVLSGALQDWDRATIIGRRTFGKGLVQQAFNLSDGSAVRLTVARYYTPLGRNIQKPYAHKSKEEYQEELITRYHNGEMVAADTSKPMGKAYKTPAGRVVYGGGGITPDVFVGTDTTSLSKEATNLYYKNTLNNFVYNYYVGNMGYWNKIASAKALATGFNPGEKEWQQLVQFAQTDSVNVNQVTPKEKSDILKRIQYLMARQIWRNEGYFEVSNMQDPVVLKALEMMQ
jgi:carboxyl-terminal processing protease